jgi:hypothetical protein
MPLERGVCPWLRAAGGPFGTVAVVCTPGGEDMRAPVVRGAMAGHDRGEMEIERARLIAERLHADDCEEDGTALLHIRRVARRLQADVQVVAWLHEVPRDFTERAQLSRAGQVGELVVVAEEALADDDLADCQVVGGHPHRPAPVSSSGRTWSWSSRSARSRSMRGHAVARVVLVALRDGAEAVRREKGRLVEGLLPRAPEVGRHSSGNLPPDDRRPHRASDSSCAFASTRQRGSRCAASSSRCCD